MGSADLSQGLHPATHIHSHHHRIRFYIPAVPSLDMNTRQPIFTRHRAAIAGAIIGVILARAADLTAQTPAPPATPPENKTAPGTSAPEPDATAPPTTAPPTTVPPTTTPSRPVPLMRIGDTAGPASFEKILAGDWTNLKPGFGDGQVYVIEFWATWCPICRRTFPHVSELATTLRTSLGDKAPTFIAVSGVDTRGENIEKAARAIAKMREQGLLSPRPTTSPSPADPAATQPIIFAFDDAAITRQAFLRPARIAAIPAAFVIDRTGLIAWIGNPATQREDFEAAVRSVSDGTFDMAAAKVRFEKQLAERARVDEVAVALQADLRAATTKGDIDQVIIAIDALIALDKDRFGRLAASKLEALLMSKADTPGGIAYARRIITSIMPDDASTLEAVSWTLLDVDDPTSLPADRIAVAFDAAQMAVKATMEEDPRALDALARAYFAKGDIAAAEKAQSRAAMLSAGEPTFESIRERLLQYRQVLDSRKKPR